jgi:hypothetical protein
MIRKPGVPVGPIVILGRIIVGLGLFAFVLTIAALVLVIVSAPPCPPGVTCDGPGMLVAAAIVFVFPVCAVAAAVGWVIILVGRHQDRRRAQSMAPPIRTRALKPPNGWSAFNASRALTELLWQRCRDWQYLNPTSDTSIWEDPTEAGASIYVAYEGEEIVELVLNVGERDGATAEVASELAKRFELDVWVA